MWTTVVGSRRVGVAGGEFGRREPHVFLVAAVRPLRARGATGADDAKLSSSLSDPTKPSLSSSLSVSHSFFFLGAAFLGAGFGLAAALGAALAFGGALGAGAGFGAGFGFGACV